MQGKRKVRACNEIVGLESWVWIRDSEPHKTEQILEQRLQTGLNKVSVSSFSLFIQNTWLQLNCTLSKSKFALWFFWESFWSAVFQKFECYILICLTSCRAQLSLFGEKPADASKRWSFKVEINNILYSSKMDFVCICMYLCMCIYIGIYFEPLAAL